MQALPEGLAALAVYRQFIVFKFVPSESKPGKMDKLPVDFRTGKVESAHDPKIWSDFETISSAAHQWGNTYGIGFVLTDNDPFCFVDADNCLVLHPSPHWSDTSVTIGSMLAGVAIEISASGTGMHYLFTGTPPPHRCKNVELGLELYHTRRFVALTGTSVVGDVRTRVDGMLHLLVDTYFKPDEHSRTEEFWTEGPQADWHGPTDDDELLRMMFEAKLSAGAAFGSKATPAELFNADEYALSKAFPDKYGNRPYDESSADAALAQTLAFWTGNDCSRIERLMWKSKLVREKWNRGGQHPYLEVTIRGAAARGVNVLNSPRYQPAVAIGDGIEKAPNRDGSNIVYTDTQAVHFQGCVYVEPLHKVFVPGGALLRPDQFRVRYGGCQYMMDAIGFKMSRDAWEAFTEHQVLRPSTADGLCFRPREATGAIIVQNGKRLVNIYVPIEVKRQAGDISRFHDLMMRMLPVERDRLILTSYMAAVVQYKGVKFQWAPMLQGVEGNGKTFFSRCVAEAVGKPYTHTPKASQLANQFNGWMANKLFYAVEDIYVPDGSREILEELKPMITSGSGIEIQFKGVDQITMDICGNFMFNSNHRDAIRITDNARRFCVFFTAQQELRDLQRDGMTGDYFSKLYEWFNKEGYAYINEFLYSFAIPDEFNPATLCQRAPETSTSRQAIAYSEGNLEQEIREAIAQGVRGFRGGWISSLQLEKVLEKMGLTRKLSHIKRREILKSMGYVLHPALPDGRVNNAVNPDCGKPRLFIHESSLALQITNPVTVAKAYEQENTHVDAIELPFASNGRRW